MTDAAGEPAAGRSIPPQVGRLDAASLSDADKTLRVLPRELRPFTRGVKMIGRAVTVEARGDLIPVLAGLQQAGSGDVLVVDAGSTSHAVLGELFASEAIRRGLAGIVVYGLCRDTATLADLPLPIYALGSTPRAHAASTVPLVSRPIRLGDVEVRPGDILVGDDDGIVVATDDELEHALPLAKSIQEREAAIRAAIEGGTSLFDLLNYREHLERLRNGQPTSLTFKV
ncbi:MAG TPA: RraA family protein [Microlunatus sp.]